MSYYAKAGDRPFPQPSGMDNASPEDATDVIDAIRVITRDQLAAKREECGR